MREARLNNMLGLAMPKELIESKPDVLYDLSEQDGRDIAAMMERHCSASALCISKLLMRTALADFRRTECTENSDDLTRLENGGVPHRLRNGYVLDTDKLGLKVWLTIFEQHCNDFLQVTVNLVESFALGMGSRKAWDKPYKKLGLGAAYNYCSVRSHDWFQLRDNRLSV